MCPPVSPCKGVSIDNGCASCAMHKHFYGWKRLLCGWGMCLLRMETPLRGRSGGHTGAAPTISRVAPCPKVGGRGSADGLKQEMIAGRSSADGLKQEMIAGRSSADGLKQEMIAGRGSADRLKQEKVAGRGSADGLKREKVAGRGSADGQNRK